MNLFYFSVNTFYQFEEEIVISKYNPLSEYYTGERCHIVEIDQSVGGDCTIALARVEPGITTQLHSLTNISERYVIVQGEGVIEMEGETLGNVQPYDVIYIPAGRSQRITNTGKIDLVFLCVCLPGFQAESYVNHEV